MNGIRNYTYPNAEQQGQIFDEALEPRKAQGKIMPTRSELENMIENSGDLIFRVDRDFRHLYVNKAVLETTGLSREEYLGKTNRELGMPEGLCDFWDGVFSQVFESGDSQKVEFNYTGTQGLRRYQLCMVPEPDSNGNLSTAVGIARDITERARAEEQLRQTERDLRRHQEALEALVAERTKELNCLFGLSNLIELHDSSLKDILPEVPDLLVPAWHYPETACARVVMGDQAFTTDNFRETPWRLSAPVKAGGRQVGAVEVGYLEESPDGDEGPFLTEERALINNIAHRLGILAERNQANEIMRLQWQQFTAIIDNFVDSLYIADPHTHEILLVNKSLERALGRNPVGGVCYKEFQGLDAPCDFCTNEIILRERKPYTWEYRSPVSKESYLVTDQIIKWPDGRDVRFEVAVDITERKKIEGALRESGRRLRRLSRKLARAQEAERKRLAKEIHDSIGGKLSGIKYGVEKLLAERGDNQPSPGISLQDVIAMVKEAIQESRRLSTSLRPPELDDLGLMRTIRSTCRRFEKLYSGRRVEMDLRIKEEDIPESLKIVIYRIIEEALTNVAKHSDAQLIRISLQNKDNGSELTIQDNGEGFRPEGVKLDAMESKSHQGLSNMRERTELSGGLFRIESEKKHGTTIRIFWPRLTATNGLQELSSI